MNTPSSDEDLDYFLETFGQPTRFVPAPPEILDAWRGKVPDRLIEYWQLLGFSSFCHGLLRLCRPDEFHDAIRLWLRESGMPSTTTMIPLFIGAFGKIVVVDYRTWSTTTLSVPLNETKYRESPPEGLARGGNFKVQVSFSSTMKDYFDMPDDDSHDLFPQALEKLGPLADNEIYGFVPALALTCYEGGVDRLKKMDAEVHMTMLAQMFPPRLYQH